MPNVSVGKLTKVPESLQRAVQRSKADYRKLGGSGLRVSNPILGGLSLGSSNWMPWILDEHKALPLLKAAYERGVSTWDTANTYSNGESERIMGKALQKFGIPREKVTIMTKCYRVVCDRREHNSSPIVSMHNDLARTSRDYVNQEGLSRAAIFNSVEASLTRLNTPYIDVLQIHRYDEEVPPEETMCALHDLVRAGKHVADKNGWTKFTSMQNHYNLLYREEEREMNKFCRLNGIGIIPWSPLASGRLARPLNGSNSSLRAEWGNGGSFYADGGLASEEIINRVQHIAEKKGWPMSHVSLAWLNRRVVAPVVGLSSIERLEDVLAARGKELSQEEEHFLESPYRPQEIQGHY